MTTDDCPVCDRAVVAVLADWDIGVNVELGAVCKDATAAPPTRYYIHADR